MSKLFRIPCIAIVTDLPRDIGGQYSISRKINEFFQSKYDGYIILTESMNDVVNKNQKPYVVIEGVADLKMFIDEDNNFDKHKEKICMYAGGLYEKYGVKTLIQAFMKLKNQDIRLHLYGSGDLERYINSLQDSRVVYHGVVTNDEIISAEKKATLLINPRFTDREYTKYSFPSKNIEYMSTGTPVLTTKLKGMPKEYYQHVYLFDEESVDGYYKTLNTLLSKSADELQLKGKSAQEFIKVNKNNKKQSGLIIDLIERM
jgi:glycosyltransferase involved in cell wall biosynthesis